MTDESPIEPVRQRQPRRIITRRYECGECGTVFMVEVGTSVSVCPNADCVSNGGGDD